MNDLIIHSIKRMNNIPEIFQSANNFEIILTNTTDDPNFLKAFEFIPRGTDYQIVFQTMLYHEGKFLRYIDLTSIIYLYENVGKKLHIKGSFIDYTPKRIDQ